MKHKIIFVLAFIGVIAGHLIDLVSVTNDEFTFRIIETTVGDLASDDLAAIIITTELTNLGRPTTAADFRLVIRQGGQQIPTEALRLDTRATLDIRSKVGPSLILNGSEWLPAKTANSTLQTGESRKGFLFFWARQASGIQIIDREDTQFAISFVDSRGRKYEAVYDAGRLNFRPRPVYAATQRNRSLRTAALVESRTHAKPTGALVFKREGIAFHRSSSC